jgi:hypothetical protein
MTRRLGETLTEGIGKRGEESIDGRSAALGHTSGEARAGADAQLNGDAAHVDLRLTFDEARWLVTAINVTQRVLEGLRSESAHTQAYQLDGLAALHRVAAQVPAGIPPYYP